MSVIEYSKDKFRCIYVFTNKNVSESDLRI